MDDRLLFSRNPLLETAEGVLRGASALLTPMWRSKRQSWGATHEEIRRVLPGDDLLPDVRWTSTHGIDINAPPEYVWPWVAQIGQGRGGFYSYTALENLFGCKMVNADTILPEFQHPQPGDEIRMHPSDAMPVFQVARVEPPSVLLLGNEPKYDEALESTIGVTWLFFLEPRSTDGTRLLTRWRMYYDPDSIRNRVAFGPLLIEPLDFVMETKMLDGIRQRAEAMALPPEPAPPQLATWDYQLPLRA
jgi:hypothetical protein